MAESIMKLRRAKGYFTSREFAEALGVSASSVSRYEAQPETMPLKMAWAMADLLGCPIDEIVGREFERKSEGRQEEFYRGLSGEGRRLFNDFKRYLTMREEEAKANSEEAAKRKYARMAKSFERMYEERAFEADDPNALIEVDEPWSRYDRLRDFVYESLAEAREAQAQKAAKEVIEDLRFQGLYETFFDGEDERPDEESFDRAVEVRVLTMAYRHMDEAEGSLEEVTNRVMDAYEDLHPEMESLSLSQRIMYELGQ